MYSRGDQIIHPRYGAGTVVGRKKLKMRGETRAYHIVELVGERGEVMIPVDQASNMNIRPAIEDLSIFEEVFALPPVQLADDYRARQAKIQKQIQTREPDAMAKALRDLYWREQSEKLTAVETKLKSQLIKMLSHEIAVICADLTVEQATSQLTGMLVKMVEAGSADEIDEVNALDADLPAAEQSDAAAAPATEVP